MELQRIDKVPAVATVMTPFPYSVDVSASLAEAGRLMRDHDVDQLPVHDGQELVGLLSRSRLARAMDAGGPESIGLLDLPHPCIVDLHTGIGAVAAKLAAHTQDAALLVREGRLAGIFTATDAFRVLATICGEPSNVDDEIA